MSSYSHSFITADSGGNGEGFAAGCSAGRTTICNPLLAAASYHFIISY
jgi:hypothetical protein